MCKPTSKSKQQDKNNKNSYVNNILLVIINNLGCLCPQGDLVGLRQGSEDQQGVFFLCCFVLGRILE